MYTSAYRSSLRVVVTAFVFVGMVGAVAQAQTVVPTLTPQAGVWIGRSEVIARPMSGAAWTGLLSAANKSCGTPNLSNQDDPANVCVMAKALVFVRTGTASYRTGVMAALRTIVGAGTYDGRALALGRELAAYVIAADLIGLKTFDPALNGLFGTKIKALLTTPTSGGPANLVQCHEMRANNWGTHCGASRLAVNVYLGNTTEVARVARVFKGWLGDRAAYSGFKFGDLWWQCDPSRPVGINPAQCPIGNLNGVLPDDQRRGGGYTWPPPQEQYVYGGLSGALSTAIMLRRAGYDVFNWESKALLRAYQWLHVQAMFPATGDDTWQPHAVNHYYGTTFPAPLPARAGKHVGWTDWTHGK